MTPCANVSVGLPVLRDVLEQPLSAATDRLSQLLVLQGGEAISIVFHPFHFLSFFFVDDTQHVTQHVYCEPFQCLKMLDYELCSLDMLSTLLMTFDVSVVVSRFVTAPAVVSVE